MKAHMHIHTHSKFLTHNEHFLSADVLSFDNNKITEYEGTTLIILAITKNQIQIRTLF